MTSDISMMKLLNLKMLHSSNKLLVQLTPVCSLIILLVMTIWFSVGLQSVSSTLAHLFIPMFDFTSLEIESISASVTPSLVLLSDYWKQQAEKDTGQKTDNPHILAARIISSGVPITAVEVNSVLEHQGLQVTQDELDTMTNLSYKEYQLTTLEAIRAFYSRTSYVWSIYMLFNDTYLRPYVGSTNNIGERIRHYFKNHSGALRPILKAIRFNGITSFKLRVYEIPEALQDLRLLLALEQYYILTTDSDYNVLKVVNGSPGGMRISKQNSLANSVPIYLYLNGVLIYVFDSMNGITNNCISGLSTTTTTVVNCLNTGAPFLSVFTMSRNKPDSVDNASLLSLETLSETVAEARYEYKTTWVRTKPAGRPKSTTPAFTVERLSDGKEFSFPNFNSARDWLRKETGAHVSNDTIRRRMENGLALNGLKYKAAKL